MTIIEEEKGKGSENTPMRTNLLLELEHQEQTQYHQWLSETMRMVDPIPAPPETSSFPSFASS